jgi:hypothetical protein
MPKLGKLEQGIIDRFRAARVDNVNTNRSTDAEQNIGIARYMDAMTLAPELVEYQDVITKDSKAAIIADCCKAVNWSKTAMYQYMIILDTFNMTEWVDVLRVVPVSTAVKLMQDSKVARAHAAYNRGDILKYVIEFYTAPPQYVAKLRTAFPCALANNDADDFVKGFIDADIVNQKTVVSALRDYHKPVAPVEPNFADELSKQYPVSEGGEGEGEGEGGAPDSVLEASAKLRERITELEALLATANGDLEKTNKALYRATHIKVSGDTYYIDSKLRQSIIAPAIRANAAAKGLEPIAVAAAKAAAVEVVESVDRDAAKLQAAAKKQAKSRAAKKGIARKAAKAAK